MQLKEITNESSLQALQINASQKTRCLAEEVPSFRVRLFEALHCYFYFRVGSLLTAKQSPQLLHFHKNSTKKCSAVDSREYYGEVDLQVMYLQISADLI